MSLPIKHQLCKIVSQLAYKAFGFNLTLQPYQVELIKNSSSLNSISFKLPLPQLIYQEYNKDGFIYSDPGVTPKQIADDILVHFKELNHVQMESDQFGNIRAIIKEQYFIQKYDKMLGQNKISCLDCDELSFHHNQSIKKVSVKDERQKELLLLFRKRPQSITLSELRQKYVFESVQKIQTQVFNRQTELLQHFYGSDTLGKFSHSQFQSKNYSQIVFGCFKHEIIKTQTVLETLFKDQNILNPNNGLAKAFKFGIVIPEQIKLSYPLKDIQKEHTSKLRKIFYDFDPQKPINLSRIDSVDSQFKSKLSKKQIIFPPSIQQLLFTTEQLLSEMKVTEIYHLYLLLWEFVKNKNSQIQFNTPSSIERMKYINAAKIIKDHLQKVLCLQEIF